MSARSATVGSDRTVAIRGTLYPVLLPKLSDPRLHLAAVIVSLQVLGQVAFDFRLSIAQILVSLVTCAVLEVGIAAWRQHVILWPASALLTGNGVAFILRVPGTVHGDWWSLNGWWIYAGTAAVSLLSKHVLSVRGRHLFNPSELSRTRLPLLSWPSASERAFPLEFWVGTEACRRGWPSRSRSSSPGEAGHPAAHPPDRDRRRFLALVRGRDRRARAGRTRDDFGLHLPPRADHRRLLTWRLLITSPEVLVFTFFMITDPKTIPRGTAARRVYAVSIGLLSVLLLAPQTTEFGTKVALLGALTLVCAARPLLELALPDGRLSARVERVALSPADDRGQRPGRSWSQDSAPLQRSRGCCSWSACRRARAPRPRPHS